MNLEFKTFSSEDYPALIGWIETPELLMQWAGPFFRFPLSVKQLDAYMQGMLRKKAIRKFYSVFESKTGNHIGHIELNNIDHKNNSARICRVLIGDKKARGKGYGKEMMEMIIKIGFEELKLHRIELGVFDFNISAIRCYQSV